MAGNEYFCKNERRLFFLYKTRRLSQWLYMTISIDDIKDKESLEAWLNERPEAVRNNYAVFIAARSALRVMPIAVDGFQFADWSRERDLTAIAFFRSVFISSVAAKVPTDDMRNAATASADAAASAFDAVWRNVRADCVVWVDHVAADGTCGIDVAPLIDGAFNIRPDWPVVREKLLNDTDSDRGADWSFWVEWYDKILRGYPQDWDMLYEIAVSQDIDWKASPREVNEAIGRIVEKHRQSEAQSRPAASVAQIARTKIAITENKAVLPPTLERIEFLISNEIKRLQQKNYADDIEMEESKRMISVFMQLLQAVRSLAEKVPKVQASDQDAEEVISTLNIYKNLINDWPRDNAPEVVDSVFRLGLVGASTGVFVMCGMPVTVSAAVSGAAFGGKKLMDLAKSLKKGSGE